MKTRIALFFLALILCAQFSEQGSIKRVRNKLPEGWVPQDCCRIFCPPKDICVCCFLDYDYFDNGQTVHVDGVPDFLYAKYNKTKPVVRVEKDVDFEDSS